MESTLRRRNGRTASAISVGSATQPQEAFGLDVELGVPFFLDPSYDASPGSHSQLAGSRIASLHTTQTSSSSVSSASGASRLSQVAPARVGDSGRNAFASLHASTSSIPRPLASMPIPRRRNHTTPASPSTATSIATPTRVRTASQPSVGESVPRLELSPQSLASFKRSFRETGGLAVDSSAPVASTSTLQPTSSPSESVTSPSRSLIDFAFLDASASSDMAESPSATSIEADNPTTSSSRSLTSLNIQPSDLSLDGILHGESSSVPRHSPPTPSAHTRVKRRRSGSSSVPPRAPSSLPRLIGRSRRSNVTSAPEILERNAQADMSHRSGEDARFLDTPLPDLSLQAPITGTRTSATHPSLLPGVGRGSNYIEPPPLTEVGLDSSRQGPSTSSASNASTSRLGQPGFVHRRPRRLATDQQTPLPSLLSPPHETPLPPLLSSAPGRPQWEALPPMPPLPVLRTPSLDDLTLPPSSPLSVRRRRGNILPLELGELPSFDIDWDQIRFGEGARFTSQTTSRRGSSQPQRPNLHRNATAVSPPEESPLTTPDGNLSALRSAETYRAFFRSDGDGDIIMEEHDGQEDSMLADSPSDISVGETASQDDNEMLGDDETDGFSESASVASSSSWLRTIVGENELASNANDWASVSPTIAGPQHHFQIPRPEDSTASSDAVTGNTVGSGPLQPDTGLNETAPWNLASEFQRAERLSQLIERRRSIATEVESHQTRIVTSTQEALERIDRYSEDTRARLRSLRAQINRDRDAFLEPFEWQLTSDDEEVTSATSRQANVSARARSRARLWGEIQSDPPISRNLLTSPVGLPRPSLSVSTATTSGLRSSGQPALRRRPGSLGLGSMRGPTRSSNEAWLRNQGIDLHESLSLPSLSSGSGHAALDEQDEEENSLMGRAGASNNWSRGSSSAARALRRIAARLPADAAANEERQSDNPTAADLLRQFEGTHSNEASLSLPALRYQRPSASHRSQSSNASVQDEASSQLHLDLPTTSPLSGLLNLPPLNRTLTQNSTPAHSASATASTASAIRGGSSYNTTTSWTDLPDITDSSLRIPGRFQSTGPANLANGPSMARPPSPPSLQAPAAHPNRGRAPERLRDQSSPIGTPNHSLHDRFASLRRAQPDIYEHLSSTHESLDLSEPASPLERAHDINITGEESQAPGHLGQVRESLDNIRRILDDLETGSSRNRPSGSEDPSSSNTSTLLSFPDRTETSRSTAPDTNSGARPLRVSTVTNAGSGWRPASRYQPIPPLPGSPALDGDDTLSGTNPQPSRPRRPMLQPFDEIYAEVEAEFAGRDRVRERLPRRRSAFMQDILAELEQRRSAPSAQASHPEPRVSRGLNIPPLDNSHLENHLRSGTENLQHRRERRDRLLHSLSTFTRNPRPLQPRPSDAVSGLEERSSDRPSFARRWDLLLAEAEADEERVPLPAFMWRSLRTSTTVGGISSEAANYVSDSELDTSYEGLLALSDRIGSGRPRGATETALREGLERSTYASLAASPATAVDGEVRCGICLEDYSEGDVLAKSKKCGHALHSVCFETWLKRVDTCPICRQSAV